MSEQDFDKKDVELEDAEEELDECEEDEECEETDTVSGDVSQKPPFGTRVKQALPVLAIYLRYLLPAFVVVLSLVRGFFYNVEFISGGATGELSLNRLYFNTFAGMHDYFGGATSAGRTSFYVLLTIGAVLGILFFLAAAFFAFLAAITAVRAFRAGWESKESDRMKLIFKIAFPGRKMLFFTNLLILLPLCYPYYFSFIGRRFLAIGGEDVIFVTHNSLFWGACVLCVLTLILALVIPRYERRKKMNMFLLNHAIETEPESENEKDEDDAGESDEA